MRKNLPMILVVLCLAVIGLIAFTACDVGCDHVWTFHNGENYPTADNAGFATCDECFERVDLPALDKSAYNVDDSNPDYVSYVLKKDDTLKFCQSNFVVNSLGYIVGYTGSSTNVVVPEKVLVPGYGGLLVEQPSVVGSEAFRGNTTIVSVTLPSGNTDIYEDTFAGCTSLTTVNFNSNVTHIHDRAFAGCTSITSFVFESSISIIGSEAFAGSGLTDLVVPATVTEVGGRAFADCLSLRTVEFYGEVGEGSMFDGLFRGCTSLEEVILSSEAPLVRFDGWETPPTPTVYYPGPLKGNISFLPENVYFYCETKPTGLDVFEVYHAINLWHYQGTDKVFWDVQFTNVALQKMFDFASNQVTVSDARWQALCDAKQNGTLEELLSPEDAEIFNACATKAEYEAQLSQINSIKVGYILFTTTDMITIDNVTYGGYTEIEGVGKVPGHDVLRYVTFNEDVTEVYAEVVVNGVSIKAVFTLHVESFD